ncbi:winged helix-turn-helix transcriptional regulator [Kitasatospora sp. NPDC059648]|uniref:winged helix-turn-helix transcriptional regulator n=1 Tax=Kitasatospora sp. NPDC059648 TaxID=3346894 RepID=UPI0036A1620A
MTSSALSTSAGTIASKWAVVVLFALSRGPRRHGELVDLVGGISRKVLTQTLRRLQSYGLIERRAYAEAPPRVEYSLTDLGQTLTGPIAALTDWAKTYGDAVANFQEAAQRTIRFLRTSACASGSCPPRGRVGHGRCGTSAAR